MNEWLIQQGINNPQTGLVVGLLTGLVGAVLAFKAIGVRASQ